MEVGEEVEGEGVEEGVVVVVEVRYSEVVGEQAAGREEEREAGREWEREGVRQEVEGGEEVGLSANLLLASLHARRV